MHSSRVRLALVLAGMALLAAACGSAPTSTTAASSPSDRPTTSASATPLTHSPICNTEMKLTQPANGTRFNGSNGTSIVLKVCGTAISMRYMPVDVDPGGSVTLDYNVNNAVGPQFLSPAGGTVVFYDQGVGNLGSVEHMRVGYQPVSTTQCASFVQNIPGPGGDYTTTLDALKDHGCVTPVLVDVVAMNK